MRFALPSRLGFLIALALTGCQGGGQSDLVTRELRMQEDQIYAMEDYLSQYQQLLCEVRAENAELKRQIADMQDGITLPAPTEKKESSKVRKSTPSRGPSFRTPARAPEEPDQLPMPPETEIIEPDVPPLEKTTLDGPRLEVRGQSPDSPVESACAPAKFVQIRGEVVVNESGGGPRLAVDVEAMSATFEPTRAVGAVSLMLLEPTKDGPPRSVARWDYSAADAQALLKVSSQPGTMQFHLELPADTLIDRPTEFWIRLMPEVGGKVLGHVRTDLSRPTRFESAVEGTPSGDGWTVDRQPDVDGTVVAAVHQDVAPAFDAGSEEGWSIARPDRKGQLGAGGDVSAGWRAASEPLPEFNANLRPAVQQAAFVEAVKTPQAVAATAVAIPSRVRTAVRTAPLWTPERGGKSAEAVKTQSEEPRTAGGPARPAWSPVR